ncbi:MAG: type I methionyl aminopeptidase, partial [Muribaculaceae bacterium]|nr:type I methionyl aminopeptidase [Muribaculaceae bacterium]
YALLEGDIIGFDTVVELDGSNGHTCYTFPGGEVTPEIMQLLVTTKESLYKGIDAARPGARIGDISNAVQIYCERRGYTVGSEMCGHGIGRKMHEDPQIPNYGRRGIGPIIKNGMILCIEPMINLGSRNIVISQDGWQCRTKDRKPSAHYEHTIAIIDDQTRILTTFDYIQEALQDRFI